MSRRPIAPATLPPQGITGLDPGWSCLVHVPLTDGTGRTWHLLDSWADRAESTQAPVLTLLCVHGNPSWSFLWRHVLAGVPDNVRVVAVDQLDMGFSERTGTNRNLAKRVEDLCQLTQVMRLTGPVVTLAHDWGGPVSLGWALRHLPGGKQAVTDKQKLQLVGVVLTNTAVHQPASSSAPSLIRLIRSRPLLKTVTVSTRAFIRGAMEMSRPALSASVRAGFYAPYLTASRRTAIADFVADIPLSSDHESAAELDGIAAGLSTLATTPALLLWGPRDRVFSDLYLHDLEQRLPHAQVHRFSNAAHFVTEDADVAGAVTAWIRQFTAVDAGADVDSPGHGNTAKTGQVERRALADFSTFDGTLEAVVDVAPVAQAISFNELEQRVGLLAAGMLAFGIRPGQRVALMVTPGIDLSLAVYACWRLGATLVLVDSGLGRMNMQRALLSANPMYLIGIDKALVAARLLGWPGIRIAVGIRTQAFKRSLDIVTDLESLCKLGTGKPTPEWPGPETVAAVAFTSGSTGPSKGVIYRHRQIQAQRDALMQLYDIKAGDRLVAAFAPFALYGPTMGITSVVPDMDVAKPASLTASALAAAVIRINATLVFASPAALVNIVATSKALDENARAACAAVRLTLSAGAPVRASLLESARSVFTNARFHTPYGMTEVLPVADISLDELQALQDSDNNTGLAPWAVHGAGVCVGYPVAGVQITIDPLDERGIPIGKPDATPGILGEIVVRAEHLRDGYDRLWYTQLYASMPAGAHRSGDIGQLDEQGRLWVGGRTGHVITTASGPVAPVAIEQVIERIENVVMAALVGVGPTGVQSIVAVVQLINDGTTKNDVSRGAASLVLIDAVRSQIGECLDIAAVLVADGLPVDLRHNSKVDRTAIAQWATQVLSGERVAAL